MEAIQIISQDLFDKVRSRFTNLEMGDETGEVTIDPAEARFFDFDVVIEGQKLGRVSISINDPGSLKVYYSKGITENVEDETRHMWYRFLREMRFFAKRRLMRFDTRDIAKNNLDKNDFQHLAATQGPKEELDMNSLQESRFNKRSTKKTSRAVTGRTQVIVRHKNSMDEMYPGARSRPKYIESIFVENGDGERWKCPINHLALGFAMAQHVDHGGVPHDPAGKAIIGMAEDLIKLQEFGRHVRGATLHDDATGITERAMSKLAELKNRMESLGKRRHYENWIAEMGDQMQFDNEAITELDSVTMEEYKSKFTQSSFQEELASYFPLLHRIMREANTVDLEDYVSEDHGECEVCHKDPCECDEEVKEDAFNAFEEWADAIAEGQMTDDEIESLKQALADLPRDPETDLPKLDLSGGVDMGWEFFQGIGLEDDDLKEKLDAVYELDGKEGNGVVALQKWANENYPDLLSKLELPEPEPEPEPQAPAQQAPVQQAPAQQAPAQQAPAQQAPAQPTAENSEMGVLTNKGRSKHRQIMAIVTEKIKSFHNMSNEGVAPFRAEENVALEVKKAVEEKFGESAGEQARDLALEFMEKQNQKWQQDHGEVQGDGLAIIERMRQLAGTIKDKVESLSDQNESIGDIGGLPGTNIMPAEDRAFEDIMKLAGLVK